MDWILYQLYQCISLFFEASSSSFYIYNYLYINKICNNIKKYRPSFFKLIH